MKVKDIEKGGEYAKMTCQDPRVHNIQKVRVLDPRPGAWAKKSRYDIKHERAENDRAGKKDVEPDHFKRIPDHARSGRDPILVERHVGVRKAGEWEKELCYSRQLIGVYSEVHARLVEQEKVIQAQRRKEHTKRKDRETRSDAVVDWLAARQLRARSSYDGTEIKLSLETAEKLVELMTLAEAHVQGD